MTGVIQAAIANPYAALRLVLGDPLHPGGPQATEDLLDRARVGKATQLVDLGCGAGGTLALARDRGAVAIGLDRQPGRGQICGTLEHLPLADGSTEVAISECAICLADDLEAALAECQRILVPGGRLALSDVVLEHRLESVPAPMAQALCLTGQRHPAALVEQLEDAGFVITSRRDHRDDLLAMRDKLAGKVDHEGLLGALGDRGRSLLTAVQEIEAAVEDGTLGYVSLVAEKRS